MINNSNKKNNATELQNALNNLLGQSGGVGDDIKKLINTLSEDDVKKIATLMKNDDLKKIASSIIESKK